MWKPLSGLPYGYFHPILSEYRNVHTQKKVLVIEVWFTKWKQVKIEISLLVTFYLGLVNKKKGVKSTLGRIFGKKDKGHHQMKALAASAAAGGVKSPAGVSLGSPQVFSYHTILT